MAFQQRLPHRALVEAKAKLTPLDPLGEAVKSEVCGAVFAARLKRYFEQHCHIKVRKYYHFVDSQTVLWPFKEIATVTRPSSPIELERFKVAQISRIGGGSQERLMLLRSSLAGQALKIQTRTLNGKRDHHSYINQKQRGL